MTTESIARLVSPLLRVRWEVALSLGRGVAVELRDDNDRLEGDERARLGELVKRSEGRPRQLSGRGVRRGGPACHEGRRLAQLSLGEIGPPPRRSARAALALANRRRDL
jgi:hypothetical protein